MLTGRTSINLDVAGVPIQCSDTKNTYLDGKESNCVLSNIHAEPQEMPKQSKEFSAYYLQTFQVTLIAPGTEV